VDQVKFAEFREPYADGHMSGKEMDNFTFESDIGYIDACGISLNGTGSDRANVARLFGQ